MKKLYEKGEEITLICQDCWERFVAPCEKMTIHAEGEGDEYVVCGRCEEAQQAFSKDITYATVSDYINITKRSVDSLLKLKKIDPDMLTVLYHIVYLIDKLCPSLVCEINKLKGEVYSLRRYNETKPQALTAEMEAKK